MWDIILTFVTLLTGHVDSYKLAAYADSTRVPTQVMWAVAWEETRDGAKGNNYVGPGFLTFDVTTRTYKRVCRERGRMQLNPCFWQSKLARCSWQRVRDNYNDNVFCAGSRLRILYEAYGSWESAIGHYNGSGPVAQAYKQRALAYIGRLALDGSP